MSAPERIYVSKHIGNPAVSFIAKTEKGYSDIEYIRSDIAAQQLSKANEEIRELKSELHQVAGDRARDRDWFNDQAATLAAMKEQRDRLLALSKHALGDHHAPGDCYVPGPVTGRSIDALCPACALKEYIAAYETGGKNE